MPTMTGNLRRLIMSDHLGTTKQPAARPSHNKEADQFAVDASKPRAANNLGAHTTPNPSITPKHSAPKAAATQTCGILATSAMPFATAAKKAVMLSVGRAMGVGFLMKRAPRTNKPI